MGPDEVPLQSPHVGARDTHLRERTEARVDAVHRGARVARREERIDGGPGSPYLLPRQRVEGHEAPAHGDVFEILECQGAADGNGGKHAYANLSGRVRRPASAPTSSQKARNASFGTPLHSSAARSSTRGTSRASVASCRYRSASCRRSTKVTASLSRPRTERGHCEARSGIPSRWSTS